MNLTWIRFWCATVAWASCAPTVLAGDSRSLYLVPADLVVPPVTDAAPDAGRRVRATTTGWEGSKVHHALYLPRDWKPEGRFPVLVEYAGNGGYTNNLGDACDGTVEGARLGFGLSGGSGFIWIAMPFVEVTNGSKLNAARWWGDVPETKRYCIATVAEACARFGGDTGRVVLCGFSRGAIACNFIGLHDDEIARVWRAFFCHSHYDGVRENWPYAGADRISAGVRLSRLRGRPQWISHEESVRSTQRYLESAARGGNFTYLTLPFPNHADAWVLRDLPERDQARAWLRDATR
jgi:hypothetical protein